MPNQIVVQYYTPAELEDIRSTINSIIEDDYSSIRKRHAWYTTDSKTIRYEDMESRHILNIYALYTKRIKEKEVKLTFRMFSYLSMGGYVFPINTVQSLLIVEGYWRGILKFPEGITEIMRIRPILYKLVEDSRQYEDNDLEDRKDPVAEPD